MDNVALDITLMLIESTHTHTHTHLIALYHLLNLNPNLTFNSDSFQLRSTSQLLHATQLLQLTNTCLRKT